MYQIKVSDSRTDGLSEIVETLRQAAKDPPIAPPTPEKVAFHIDQHCSQADQFGRVLAYENDEIIAGVLLYKRTITFKDRPLLLGGIGGVWTRRDKRRQGIATVVLQRGMEVLREVGCEIAYLGTDIDRLHGLYEGVGFRILNRPFTYLGKSGTRYTDDNAMVAPVTSDELFRAVMTDSAPFDIGTGDW